MITNFIDNNTVITASWLNKVDRAVSDAIGQGTDAPTTPAQVKQNLGLDNVDNTSDLNKPISTATQAVIDAEVAALEATDLLRVPRDSSTGAASIPTGTTAERPGSPAQGMFRRNSQLGQWEGYNGASWDVIPDTSGVATITGTQTLQNKTLDSTNNISGASGHLAGLRNKIINGGFAVNQRSYVSGATVGSGLYGHDRWKMAASGDTYTFSTTDNKTTVTIPAGKVLQQVIEGLNLQTGTYTLSWEGTAQGKIGAGSYGASGITGSITGGTNTTIEFGPGTVANVQLEAGSIATPFEHRPYGLELSLCQRYYEAQPIARYLGFPCPSTGGYAYRFELKWAVQKRTNPTCSWTIGSTSNVASYSTSSQTPDCMTIQVVGTSQANTTFTVSGVSASAEL